ncbi:MAG TPA: hypothetical protein PLL94_15070, partial [Bacteroidales bacterium]|nr:hypothetical protein [Bacteroidales bacterium]
MKVIKEFGLWWHYNIHISLSMLAVLAITLSCENARNAKIPEVETEPVTKVTSTSAVSGGKIIHNGGFAITIKGVCWSSDANPTIRENSHTEDGSGNGNFTSTLTSLNPDTEYHVRAYAVNQEGIGYGDVKIIRTMTEVQGDQIIADHTVVDKYDDIPQY